MRWLQLGKDFLHDMATAIGALLILVLTPVAGAYGLPLLLLWRLCNALHLKPLGWVFYTLAWPTIKYIAFIKPKVEGFIGKKFAKQGIMPFEDMADPRD